MVAGLCLAALLWHAQAADYAIHWNVIAGGGVSRSDRYAVSGAIGQPEAGPVPTALDFSLAGGFWTVPFLVQAVQAPVLAVTLVAPEFALVSWTPTDVAFVLQESADPALTEWTNAPTGTTNPALIRLEWARTFYRLREE